MSRKIIAILRGIEPERIVEVADIVLEAGISTIEIPLNSPQAFDSIALLVETFHQQGVFGAGTVLEVQQVQQLAEIGAALVVSPNCNAEVIRATKSAGLLSYPGVMTPSECFTALQAGADALKLFPGELIGPAGMRAMRAVLPSTTQCYAVGGSNPDTLVDWLAAGANGFGVGSALFQPSYSSQQIAQRAKAMVESYDRAVESMAT